MGYYKQTVQSKPLLEKYGAYLVRKPSWRHKFLFEISYFYNRLRVLTGQMAIIS